MKFLLDENVPADIKRMLFRISHEPVTLKDLGKLQLKNGEVAKLSIEEGAILITFDSDFLELKKSLKKLVKVIYIRMHPRDPKKASELLEERFLDECIDKMDKPSIITLDLDELKIIENKK